GEGVAAGAGTGEEIAFDVAAECGDLVGICANLGEAGRRLIGVKPGLLEQVLVVEESRYVGIERNAIEAALIGSDLQMSGACGLERRVAADEIGDIGQLSGRFELRTV